MGSHVMFQHVYIMFKEGDHMHLIKHLSFAYTENIQNPFLELLKSTCYCHSNATMQDIRPSI